MWQLPPIALWWPANTWTLFLCGWLPVKKFNYNTKTWNFPFFYSPLSSYEWPVTLLYPVFHGLSFGIKFIRILFQVWAVPPWNNIISNRVYQMFIQGSFIFLRQLHATSALTSADILVLFIWFPFSIQLSFFFVVDTYTSFSYSCMIIATRIEVIR